MYRTATSRLRALKGRTANKLPARFTSSTAFSAKPKDGLFSWLTGEHSSSSPSLVFPLPEVVLPPPISDYVEPEKTEITTLPNGVKIASETSTWKRLAGNVWASASRKQMGCTFDALKTYLTQMVEILVDCMRNPVFLDREVNETLPKMKSEIANASKDLPNLLLEAIHSTGYSGALQYAAPRIALAAYGAEHEELLSVAEPLLSDLPKVSRPAEP